MKLGRSRPPFWKLVSCLLTFVVGCISAGGGGGGGDIWPLERPEGMTQIQSLEVMCGKDHMDVHLSFTHPFEGIVFSKGQYGDPRCVYVAPSTGRTFFSFRIAYARCGTKPDLHGQFYENTVVVQYDKDLLEVWDEAKRLRCEWFNDYEKTASKPPMVIADLDVIQLDFRGDNVDCWMEIQHGKGPWAPPVSGIVPLGSTLTLVVAINDYRGEFDMRVKSCAASDGAGHVIQLSDENGCVLRPKMISRFLKAKGADERASVITYAFFHAFKFPDALSVHIKCKVEICRHGCLDHCQLTGDFGHLLHHPSGPYGDAIERKDNLHQPPPPPPPNHQPHIQKPAPDLSAEQEADLYDDLSEEVPNVVPHRREPDFSSIARDPSSLTAQTHKHVHQSPPGSDRLDDIKGDPLPQPQFQEMPRPGHRDGQERFPHGPRNLDTDSLPIIDTGSSSVNNRRRRSVVVSDRKARSTDVGVSGLYEVISEADLAFTPDTKAEAVTVFQGRIREEVVYGICLPMPGFSVLFVLVAVSAVVAALVAGSLLYRYQLQKEAHRMTQQRRRPDHRNGVVMSTGWTNWMAMRLLRARIQSPCAQNSDRVTVLRAARRGPPAGEGKELIGICGNSRCRIVRDPSARPAPKTVNGKGAGPGKTKPGNGSCNSRQVGHSVCPQPRRQALFLGHRDSRKSLPSLAMNLTFFFYYINFLVIILTRRENTYEVFLSVRRKESLPSFENGIIISDI